MDGSSNAPTTHDELADPNNLESGTGAAAKFDVFGSKWKRIPVERIIRAGTEWEECAEELRCKSFKSWANSWALEDNKRSEVAIKFGDKEIEILHQDTSEDKRATKWIIQKKISKETKALN